MNFYKITGLLLAIMSGLIYTLERGVSLISSSLIKAGFFSGRMTGEVPEVEASGFFSNLFVPLFFFTGLALIIYSIKKK
ncbi:hypothetical protein [Pseudalkalibacillus berkeleyi]|uniref:Uncharacterized protein n=1 Tax=Pseudalkalibacillus berkeleyi TaxID=1069813 RepID=A0ABS9GYE6_9BACL|nr:hypothetical protein [Pseudalkalibacillus berkeleyi]MCF6137709.1 hypothetical protein [Pseudalkalibacillus berkeleyi]